MPDLRKILLLCGCFCAISIPANAIEPLARDPAEEIPACKLTGGSKDMELELGSYLSKSYLNKLLEARSHVAAVGATALAHKSFFYPQVFYVRRDGDKFTLSDGFNWHEGGGILHVVGTHIRFFDNIEGAGSIIDKCHFRRFGDTLSEEYIFVGESDNGDRNFITHVVLVGVYVDDNGRRYVFGADKKATFPDRVFYYELVLDRVGDSNEKDDVFLFSDKKSGLQLKPDEEGKFMAFRRVGNELVLYPARISEVGLGSTIADHAHPIARLHKISD